MNVCKEIVLCKNCNGEGALYRHKVTDYHRNEYDVIKTKCIMCDGSGRLWQITTVEYQKIT